MRRYQSTNMLTSFYIMHSIPSDFLLFLFMHHQCNNSCTQLKYSLSKFHHAVKVPRRLISVEETSIQASPTYVGFYVQH